MGVMTPHRGIKILTRAGQGLQNSDTELEQLICQILGNEIHSGSTLVARDDSLVGGNSIDELIDKRAFYSFTKLMWMLNDMSS